LQESAVSFFIMLVFLEIFEIIWQKGHNFREYIKSLFGFYKQSVLLFIVLHPTLYFVIFSQIALSNYSFLASALTLIKVFDLGFKISLLDKIYNKKELGSFEPILKENYQISWGIKLSGLIIYSCLFFFAYIPS